MEFCLVRECVGPAGWLPQFGTSVAEVNRGSQPVCVCETVSKNIVSDKCWICVCVHNLCRYIHLDCGKIVFNASSSRFIFSVAWLGLAVLTSMQSVGGIMVFNSASTELVCALHWCVCACVCAWSALPFTPFWDMNWCHTWISVSQDMG